MNNPWQSPTPVPDKPSWLTDDIENLLKAYNFPLTNDGMLMLWQKSKENLDRWKGLEMDFRKICANMLVQNHQHNEGTNTVELGGGYQAKVGIKFNYKLDSDNEKIWSTLDRIAKVGNEGSFIAKRLISWTPNFLVTEYRTLMEEKENGSQDAANILKELESVLVISEAAPTLDIKEPRKKKS